MKGTSQTAVSSQDNKIHQVRRNLTIEGSITNCLNFVLNPELCQTLCSTFLITLSQLLVKRAQSNNNCVPRLNHNGEELVFFFLFFFSLRQRRLNGDRLNNSGWLETGGQLVITVCLSVSHIPASIAECVEEDIFFFSHI